MRKDEPGQSGSKRTYTVMIARGAAGRLRSFEISSITVFVLAFAFLIYVLGSGLVLWDYWDQRQASKGYLEELDRLRVTVREMRQGLFSARENLKLLEDYVKGHQKDGVRGQGDAAGEERPDGKVHAVKAGSESPEEAVPTLRAPVDEEAGKTSGAVNIERMKINRKGRVLTIDFRIVNVKRKEGPVAGYIHMIASNDDANRPRLHTFPGVTLKDGEPIHYKRGQAFSIKRLKPVKGEFVIGDREEMPSSLRVLVYDRSGEKLFEKTYEVEHGQD